MKNKFTDGILKMHQQIIEQETGIKFPEPDIFVTTGTKLEDLPKTKDKSSNNFILNKSKCLKE